MTSMPTAKFLDPRGRPWVYGIGKAWDAPRGVVVEEKRQRGVSTDGYAIMVTPMDVKPEFGRRAILATRSTGEDPDALYTALGTTEPQEGLGGDEDVLAERIEEWARCVKGAVIALNVGLLKRAIEALGLDNDGDQVLLEVPPMAEPGCPVLLRRCPAQDVTVPTIERGPYVLLMGVQQTSPEWQRELGLLQPKKEPTDGAA